MLSGQELRRAARNSGFGFISTRSYTLEFYRVHR